MLMGYLRRFVGRKIKAKYEHGVFTPLEHIELDSGEQVEIQVLTPNKGRGNVTDSRTIPIGKRVAFTIVQFIVLFLSIVVFDLWGKELAWRSALDTRFYRWDAVQRPQNDQQLKVLIVRIDESDVTNEGGRVIWPLPYYRYFNFFKAAFSLCPSGIFVDIDFAHPVTKEDRLSELQQGLRRLPEWWEALCGKQSAPKIFLPSPSSTFTSEGTLKNLNYQYVSIDKAPDIGAYHRRDGTTKAESAAFAIAREFCWQPADTLPPPWCAALKELKEEKPEMPDSIQLRWNFLPPPWRPLSRDPLCEKAMGVRLYAMDGLFGSLQMQKDSCPPVPTIGWTEFIQLSGGQLQELRNDMTKGIVMLGLGASDYFRDHYATPTHTDLPGVYVHAIALTNLVTSPKTIWEPRDPLGVNIAMTLGIGLAMGVMFAGGYLTHQKWEWLWLALSVALYWILIRYWLYPLWPWPQVLTDCCILFASAETSNILLNFLRKQMMLPQGNGRD